jgi:hypothetical protein
MDETIQMFGTHEILSKSLKREDEEEHEKSDG